MPERRRWHRPDRDGVSGPMDAVAPSPMSRSRRVSWAVIAVVVLCLSAACGAGGGPPAGSASTPSARTASKQGVMLAYSHCMRAHGIADYPDPDSHGGLPLDGPAGSDLDPASSTYQQAGRTCGSLLPGGAAAQQQERAKMAAAALAFARCMRSHGISGFPDPAADGQFAEAQMRGLGKGSPQFDAAQEACKHALSVD